MSTPEPAFTAFEGTRRIASGSLAEVSIPAARATARRAAGAVLVFDDATGRPVDLDLRGSEEEVRARAECQADELRAPSDAAEPARRGPGRPRLGVVGKEVTLLPRHWGWLSSQSGGASAALRRLVDQARKHSEGRGRIRQDRDVVYRFMSAMAGDLPGFEEALRALFRGDRDRFLSEIGGWPADLRDHTRKLASNAFEEPPVGGAGPHGER